MRPIRFLALVMTAGAALGFALHGCSNNPPATSQPDSGAVEAAPLPCPDAGLFAPLDSAPGSEAGACRACLADPASALGDASCASMLEACSADCVCKAATVAVGACTSEGLTAQNCLLRLLTASGPAAQDLPFIVLQQCQISTCAAACENPTDGGDAGTTDAAPDGDADATNGTLDGSADAAAEDAAPDGKPDAVAEDTGSDSEPDARGDAGADGD
jgi:hypothetical protein